MLWPCSGHPSRARQMNALYMNSGTTNANEQSLMPYLAILASNPNDANKPMQSCDDHAITRLNAQTNPGRREIQPRTATRSRLASAFSYSKTAPPSSFSSSRSYGIFSPAILGM
jgi:hypothetical protein